MAEADQQAIMSSKSDTAQACDDTQATSSPVVQFREIFDKQTLEGFQQDARFQVVPPNINDLSHFLLPMVEKIRPM